MNDGTLKEVISDQKETIKNAVVINRDFCYEDNVPYVLIGLRRAGKSTQLYTIAKKLVEEGVDWNQIVYINFEDERLSEFQTQDFNSIVRIQAELSEKQGYFFLDEIQNIAGWEKFARRMADSKEHIYITGSNAHMLSSEIETTLGGRFLTRYISTYNFSEYLRAKNVLVDSESLIQTKKQGNLLRLFTEFYTFGGFPECVDYNNKREYLSSVFQKVLLGDIATRNGIRNINALKLLTKKIAESVTSEISFTKLHNLITTIGAKISKDSVIDYVSYIQDAFLVFSVKNYFSKFTDKESNPKYYFSDNGLLNLFLLKGDTALLENIVSLALHNTYHDEVYFLKSAKTGIDVDFYLPTENTVIQVAFSLQNISNTREVENLVKLSKSMSDVTNFIILTYNEEDTIETENITIKVIPVWKWLLTR